MAGPITKTGRYQIVAELGRGSMGVVYQGFDPIIGRTVAIKTMLIEGLPPSEFEEYKARFQREAQSAGVLTHPNIVTVYDFGEDEGVLYLAMEFLEGKSIQELVDKHNILPIETILPMYEQICGALDHAHQHKIVHRDIKPANIMILSSGQVKVTDFGIAKIMSMGMTQAGQILGTPNYMSPEQVKGRQIDGRSDIFSLGVILYELVTGEKPFGGQNITTVIYKIINENPIPPRELDATIHPGLSYVIAKALAKSPEERYQTCRELAEDLRNYKNLGSVNPPSATVVIRVPPLQAQPVAPPPAPPRVTEPRVEQPVVEPRRAPTPPPAPAPREPRVPPAVVSAPRVQQNKGSSTALWVVLAIILTAGLGGGGFYFFSYLPRQTNKAGEPANAPQAVPKNATATPTATTNQAQTNAQDAKQTAVVIPPPVSENTPPVVEKTQPQRVQDKQAATPSGKNGKVNVASNVNGASISVDGQGTGFTTPHQLDLAAGEYEISLSKDGYTAEKRTVTVKSGRNASARFQLAEVAPPPTPKPETPAAPPAQAAPPTGEGSVEITTIPEGLAISIDEKPVGPSPARATLPVGKHTYSFTCPDADPQTKSFTIKPNGVIFPSVKCKLE